LWIVGQCKAGAPDTRDIREVIYSPDGVTVKRWDRLGKRSSGDDSHRDHTHISYHRDAEGRDKVSLFKRFFEGTPSDLPGGIMLPKYGLDGDYGDEMTAAVKSWFNKRGGTGFDGKSITSWIAMTLQRQLFTGARGPAGKDGRDGVLQLPATVAITGQVTAIDGDA
jgi:hypothetical protein